ncbi:MAG: VWA domain-containing protein [Chloroflexi bacterium]|nr:VWA domain-containing protein [Chloroflexota bacterium]
MTFTARADRRFIRTAYRSQRFVLATIVAPEPAREHVRLPVNLAFVLDRSGSMSGGKLELARTAVESALARLQPDDRFSVVVYDDVVDVVVDSTTASAEARRNAVDRLRAIDPRGSTNLGDGWLRGCEQVANRLHERGVNRVLLLTDGLANVGMTDPAELARHATELRARGVATSTFGVGNDFDEALLTAMADAGGGHFRYIADARSIEDHMTSEVGETLEVVARDATLEVTAPEGVLIESVSPYRVQARGNRTLVSLGDLVANQVLEVVLRLRFPYGDEGRESGAIVAVTDRDGVFAPTGRAAAEPARLVWTYATDRANDEQTRDGEVDRAVARIYAARARQEAVGLNRVGDYQAARRVLEATAKRIRGYAGRDPELRGLAERLTEELVVYAAPMAEASRKQLHFASTNVARTRDAQGRSVKRPS